MFSATEKLIVIKLKKLTLNRQTQHICNVSKDAELCTNSNNLEVTAHINRFVAYKSTVYIWQPGKKNFFCSSHAVMKLGNLEVN